MTIDQSIHIRPARLEDLPHLTEIQNHYIENTHITFEIRTFTPEQRIGWFNEHSDGKRYRILVAEDKESHLVGYVATGRFRPKQAYDTTAEICVACSPNVVGKGIGTRLYTELFALLRNEDVHRVVAGIAQPNPASNALCYVVSDVRSVPNLADSEFLFSHLEPDTFFFSEQFRLYE